MFKQLIKRAFLPAALASCALALVSCASGPSYAEAVKSMPPVPKGKGRVFVYRDSSLGAAVRPKVRIDEQPVGTSAAKGFVYSDQTAGQHVVSLVTETSSKATVNVVAGQPTFVKTSMKLGAFVGHTVPKEVSRQQGESEIQSCKLVTP